MTSSIKNFQTAILILSAAILVVPQAVAAGGGQGGHAHGHSVPSIQTSLNSPLRGVSNSNTTINSSSGPVLAHTANNLATSTVLDKSITTSSKQTKIVASVSNLNGSGTLASGQSTPHNKQVMDESGTLGLEAGPMGPIALLLGLDPQDDPNQLIDGKSTSQYGDGATMNYPKQATPVQMSAHGISSTSSTPKALGKASDSTTINAVVHEKTPNVQTLTNVSGADIGKNALGRNNFATAKNVGGSDIGKNANGGSASSQPSPPNPPAPPKPTPMPKPYPSGSIFVSGFSDDNPTSTSTSDNATTAAATPTAATSIDLVLEDVQLASPATLVAGPAYTIRFRNQGSQASGKFVVGIFATLDETPTMQSPHATVELPGMTAGQVRSVTLRLPLAAMKLTSIDDSQSTEFTHLFVAVDLMNSVSETDKTNNTAVVERAAVKVAAAN